MKKNIPCGKKLQVQLTTRERDLILDETLCDPGVLKIAIVADKSIKVNWSLDEIEDVQGYVAAEANHTNDKKLERELDKLSDKLQVYLDCYDDQDE